MDRVVLIDCNEVVVTSVVGWLRCMWGWGDECGGGRGGSTAVALT